jgi:hypothetical protein
VGGIIGAFTGNAPRGLAVGGILGATGLTPFRGGRKRSKRLGGGSKSKTCPTGTYRVSKKMNGRRRKVCSRTAYARRNGVITGGKESDV